MLLSLEQILLYGFIGVVIMRYMSGILADIQTTLQLIRFDVLVQKKAGKRLARVTMVVVVRNMEQRITSYILRMSKLLQSTRNIDVLIVDNASTDKTVAIARGLAKEHKNITIYSRRKYTKNNSELLKIIRRQAKGSVLMLTTPRTHITKHLLERSQKLYVTRPKAEVIQPLSLLHKPKNLGMVLSIFNTASHKRFSKLNTVTGSSSKATTVLLRKRCLKTNGTSTAPTQNFVVPSGYLVTYRENQSIQNAGWLPKIPVSKKRQITQARRAYQRFSSLVFNLEPYVYAYMLYIAIGYNRTDMLIIAWSLVTGAYAYALFTTNFYTFTQKIQLTMYVPILFVVALITTIALHAKIVFVYLRNKALPHQKQQVVSA